MTTFLFGAVIVHRPTSAHRNLGTTRAPLALQREGAIVRRRHQQGVTSIEYALIASLIAIAIVSGVTAVGGANAFNWGTVADKILTALGG